MINSASHSSGTFEMASQLPHWESERRWRFFYFPASSFQPNFKNSAGVGNVENLFTIISACACATPLV
jgi:hypothetical protein